MSPRLRWDRFALLLVGDAAGALTVGFLLSLVLHGWALTITIAAVLAVYVLLTHRPVMAWLFEPRRPRAWTEDQLP